ncbi:MAG: DUF1993 family protein [Paracoccaceae bacterium]
MAALYTASVPVLRHYLDRIEGMLERVQGREALLLARLAPDMFTCGQQFATAMGFALRASYPLAGRPVPDAPDAGMDRIGLLRRLVSTRAALDGLVPDDFIGADARMVSHRAGFAELSQTGAEYLHLFAMPNFLFHTTMGFAILRGQGVEIGKADFDGLHDYPHGFRF